VWVLGELYTSEVLVVCSEYVKDNHVPLEMCSLYPNRASMRCEASSAQRPK
jgi:hypothetical protein